MPAKSPDERILLTIHLPGNVATRLELAAAAQKRAAADVVVALLDKHLPRLDTGKKKPIAYA
jgi:hypothetical protein